MRRLDPSFFDAPIAHRGLHDSANRVIENSMSAVKAAIAGGYGIEIDLQPADDLTPMVFHDYLLDRLTNERGAIKARSVQDLNAIHLKNTGEGIPTLADVLGEVAGQVPLLVEIKDQDMRLGADVGTFQDKVGEVIGSYSGPIAVMSFSPDTIRRFARVRPDIAVGLVTDPFRAEDWPSVPEARRKELACLKDAANLDVDFISHQQKDLTSPRVAALKSKALPVFCWTIRSAAEEARAREVADNITFEGYVPARRV